MINLILWPVLYVAALWGLGQLTNISTVLVTGLTIVLYFAVTSKQERKPLPISTRNIALTITATIILVVASLLLTDKLEATRRTYWIVVVMAPLAEEIVFRELSFKQSKLNPIVAAVVSTALFAVAHGLSLNVVIASAIAGLTLCALYYFTDALAYAIIAHILANLILVFI